MSSQLPTDLRHGAGAGLAATVVMSAVMLAADKFGATPQPPPQRITDHLLHRTGSRPSRGLRRALGTAAHLGFGAGAGAAYAAVQGRGRLPGPPAASGVGYGLGVWAASYAGWIPALGALPPPEEDRPGRVRTMVIAHIVYGAVLGALVGRGRSPVG